MGTADPEEALILAISEDSTRQEIRSFSSVSNAEKSAADAFSPLGPYSCAVTTVPMESPLCAKAASFWLFHTSRPTRKSSKARTAAIRNAAKIVLFCGYPAKIALLPPVFPILFYWISQEYSIVSGLNKKLTSKYRLYPCRTAESAPVLCRRMDL